MRNVVPLMALFCLCFGTSALADGTETLGAPAIAIADGTGLIGNGVGMINHPANPNPPPYLIDFEVPAGASVEQVLLYWNGFHSAVGNGDDSLTLTGDGGPVPVTGDLIGGPTLFFSGGVGDTWSSTYRADITALGLIGAGPNTVEVSDASFDRANNGATIVAIFDDGTSKSVQLLDGQDLAFLSFAPPLDTTVPQTFSFAPSNFDRDAELLMLAASVRGPASGDDQVLRPNAVRVTLGGGGEFLFVDPFNSLNGPEWDHVVLSLNAGTINIPAGETELTVQALSIDDGSGKTPASMAWIFSGLELPEPTCGDGNVDPGEFCDDGNEIDDDGCRNDCTACGDGVVNGDEECDFADPNAPADCGQDCMRICPLLTVDKQVSCDSGLTWGDSCTGWDNPNDPNNPYQPEVLVRYIANTAGEDGLTDCVLTDSNPAVLAAPVAVGDLPQNSGDVLIHQTGLLTCDTELEMGEPDTATLSCTCLSLVVPELVIAQDTAEIECQVPDLEIEKVCDREIVETGLNTVHLTVTNPPNPRGASLINCSIQERLIVPGPDIPVPFNSGLFDLAPGESIDFDFDVDLEALGVSGDALNAASVICQIDGAPGKIFVAGDQDLCETCEIDIDKQVSCDGGMTWGDSCTGYEVPGEPSIKVRYLADVPGGEPVVNCVLTDSNGEVLPAPVDVGAIPGASSGVVIHETDLLDCSEELAMGEPNTAVLSCECYADGSGQFREAEDTADIECQRCGDDVIQPAFGETCEPNLLLPFADAVTDGSFEGGSPSGDWVESSPSPLASASGTGIGGQFGEGDWFAWFRAAVSPASITQTVDLTGVDGAELRFQLWLVDCKSADDVLEVKVNGTDVVFSVDTPAELELTNPPLCAFGNPPGYVEQVVDLGAYVGQVVDIEFAGDFSAGTGDVFVDAVQVVLLQASELCRDDCTFCGDGIRQDPEGCDDGNDIDDDGCRNDCSFCGDLVVDEEAGETCDPPAGAGSGELIADGGFEAGQFGGFWEEFSATFGAVVYSSGEIFEGSFSAWFGDMGPDQFEEAFVAQDVTLPDGAIADLKFMLLLDVCSGVDTDIFEVLIDDAPVFSLNMTDALCGAGWTEIVVDLSPYTLQTVNLKLAATLGTTGVNSSFFVDNVTLEVLQSDSNCREDCTFCGDGILNGDEECDFNDPNADPRCSDECIIIRTCGDGFLDPGESCDPNDPNAPDNCREDCTFCGDGEVNGGEFCDDANDDDNDGCRNDCTACGDGVIDPVYGETCDPPGLPAGSGNLVADGSFEEGSPNPFWTEFSTNFGSPLCDPGFCGFDLAADGAWWVWFGGTNALEEGIVSQPINLPAGASAQLSFALWLITCNDVPEDGFTVKVNDDVVFSVDLTDDRCDNAFYSLETVDLTAYAGQAVTLEFSAITGTDPNVGGGNIFLDLVSVEVFQEALCSEDCTFCGDGNVDPGEECDPADPNGPDCTPDCREPSCPVLTLDKQVSCDSGLTWGESCTGWDNPNDPNNPYQPEVLVRYVASTAGEGPLTDCELIESNPAVLGGPVFIGDLPENTNGQVIHQTGLLACDTTLEEGEPDTATLSCSCPLTPDGPPVVDDDTADITCLVPDLEIEKDCDREIVETGLNAVHLTVTNPPNPRGASLINCSIQERLIVPGPDIPVPFNSGLFDLAPGESIDFDFDVDLEALGVSGDALNAASVICQIDGAPGKIFVAGDQDLCETCEIDIDKQVSCDGGMTWGDSCTGYETPGEPSIKVRYLADVPGGEPVVNCVLTDSNGEVLPAPVDIGTIPGALSGLVIHETDLLDCSEELAMGEPNTAVLSCECYEDASGQFREAEDTADIECQRCGDDVIQPEFGETCEPNLLLPFADAISDGSFEGGSPNGDWTESSPSPLASASGTGIGGQFGAGDWFAWFRAAVSPASISQSVDLTGVDGAELRFQLWLVDCKSADDVLEVKVNGTDVVFSVETPPELELTNPPQCAFGNPPGYIQQVVDLSAYIGQVVDIEFAGDFSAGTGDVFVDAVEVVLLQASELCRDDCTFCGDGVANGDEGCDDGNDIDDDDCRNDCSFCGDMVVDEEHGETCDPPAGAGSGELIADGGFEAGQFGGFWEEFSATFGAVVYSSGEIFEGSFSAWFGDMGPDQFEEAFVAQDVTLPEGAIADLKFMLNLDVCSGVDTDIFEVQVDGSPVFGLNMTDALCGAGWTEIVVDLSPYTTQTVNLKLAATLGTTGVNSSFFVDNVTLEVLQSDSNCREDCSFCGDGILNGDEECDFNDPNAPDNCTEECLLFFECGDGVVTAELGETCDPPGDPAGASGNDCRDDCTVCGDGIVNGDEFCDDGNNDNDDGCRNDCTACGDGVVDGQYNETCDPPGVGASTGNLVQDGSFEAGTPNPFWTEFSTNFGTTLCDPGSCGFDLAADGAWWSWFGGTSAAEEGIVSQPVNIPDGASATLQFALWLITCSQEESDFFEVNVNDTTVFSVDLTDARCDNGFYSLESVDLSSFAGQAVTLEFRAVTGTTGVGGNIFLDLISLEVVSDNICRDDCTFCGDGILDAGEQCDDGNTDDFDGCSNQCMFTNCEVKLDKQVSCDGGNTYVDAGFDDMVSESCIGWDGQAEVQVRYVASTNADMVNCELVDANGLVLPGPVAIGNLPGNLDEFVIWETAPLECSEELDGAMGLASFMEDFEGLDAMDTAALGDSGWLVFGNVFNADWSYAYGYGVFPAPNDGAAFSAVVSGEGGADQGAQQLSVFSDYNNGDHGNNRFIEANVFQERTVSAADVGSTWTFKFDAKAGNIEGGTTAQAFFKTLDPNAGFALTNFITADMTNIPNTWDTYSLSIFIDASLEGQLLQFGFLSLATNFEGSGIFYDNVAFFPAFDMNTATLSCECFEEGSGISASDSDSADIECQQAELVVEKDCANQDPATGTSDVTVWVSNPANDRGASLVDCRVKDELAGFMSEPFDLAPGESAHFDLAVHGLTEPTLNIAWVDCEIVGAGGKRIGTDALDLCRVCPEPTLDKQVSCDGGNTFVDVGEDGGLAETCVGREGGDIEVMVRFVVNGLLDGLHSDCVIVDSNGAILPVPQPIFGFPGAVFETPLKDCDANLAAGEPDTAVLTCTCYEGEEGYTVSADDEANIECVTPECGDGITETNETCDPPGDPAGASGNICRQNCTVCGDGVLNSTESCDDGNDIDDDGCRNDCTACGDGILDHGEECDDGNNEDGDGCSSTCMSERQCELDVVKTCVVPGDGDDDDDDDNDCDGKVLSMKLAYTGEGCDATNNFQEGRVSCFGDAAGAEPVSVLVTDTRGDRVYGDGQNVFLGDVVEATAANAGEDKFESNTLVTIGDGAESVTFHTSCSKPLAVGDQFGSMLLVELTTTEGGTVSLPAIDPDAGINGETSECTVAPPPPAPHCDGKIQSVSFRLLGGDCAQTTQDQEGRFECSGAVAKAFTPVVGVTCFAGGDVFFDSMGANVTLGDVFSVDAANAGSTSLPSQMDCLITDEFDNVVMSLSIHTSCSKPVNLGDIFGALEVFALDTTGGGSVGLATEVTYNYRITNLGDFPAVNVTAVDSELGPVPGSPVDSIAPSETVLLSATALISETTTNTVTVNGTLETGEVCDMVEDSATVTVEQPPQLQECTSSIDAMLLQYIGPDVPGPVTVEVKPRNVSVGVVYDLPGGLTSGMILSAPGQNDFTVDPGMQGDDSAGSKTSIFINGDEEVHHTSCSTPYVSGLPAPLDDPKGDPSPNWFVVDFTQK